MRDNFATDWLRRKGAWRSKRLSDNTKMAKISRSYQIKIFSSCLNYIIV